MTNIGITGHGMKVPKVNRTGATIEGIKSYILSAGLHPGDPLPTEQELCEGLGVSRSSVREALRTLQALDLVEVRQGRGTFVGAMSLTPLVDALAFRAILEAGSDSVQALRDVIELRGYLSQAVAPEVVGALKGKQTPELDEVVATMCAKAERGESFGEEDHRFHQLINSVTPNQVAAQMESALWEVHMAVVQRLEIPVSHHLVRTARIHKIILEAAKKGDLEAYRKAVQKHFVPLEEVLNSRPIYK